MWCAAFALQRSYAIVASPIFVCLMGIGAALGMPIDIFPELGIPVLGVVWTYNATSALDVRDRVLTLHERQLASLVDDISRIDATSYNGVGVEKVYLHQGADISRTITQLASCAPVVLKYMSAEYHAARGVARWRGGHVHHLAWRVEQLAAGHLNDLG
jgi:multidrug efflux pump subunit AcrB